MTRSARVDNALASADVRPPRAGRLEIEPRGLCREDAARYIGVSPSKFDQMVDDGRMPGPKKIDARRVWDRWSLDRAFDALEGDAATERDPWGNPR
jgi:hypothetical protein